MTQNSPSKTLRELFKCAKERADKSLHKIFGKHAAAINYGASALLTVSSFSLAIKGNLGNNSLEIAIGSVFFLAGLYFLGEDRQKWKDRAIYDQAAKVQMLKLRSNISAGRITSSEEFEVYKKHYMDAMPGIGRHLKFLDFESFKTEMLELPELEDCLDLPVLPKEQLVPRSQDIFSENDLV